MGTSFPYGICRMCGAHPPVNSISASKIPFLLELAKKHLDLQIKETDKCSKLVCQSCVNCVKNFSIFSARVKATQLTIEQYMLLQEQECEATESGQQIKIEDETVYYVDDSRNSPVDEPIVVDLAQRPDSNEQNVDSTKRACPKSLKAPEPKRRKTISSSTTQNDYTLLNTRCVTCSVFVKTTFEQVFHDHVHTKSTCLYCMESIGSGPELVKHFMLCFLAQCHSVDVLMRYAKKCSVRANVSYDNLQPQAQPVGASQPSTNIVAISKPHVQKKKLESGGLLISEKLASRYVNLKRKHVRKSHFQEVPFTLKMSTGEEPRTDLYTLSIPLIRHRLTTELMSQQYTSQEVLSNTNKICELEKSSNIVNIDIMVGSNNSENNSPNRSIPSSDNEEDDCTLISETLPSSNLTTTVSPMLFTRISVSRLSSNEVPTAFIDLLDESSNEGEMPRLVIDETQVRQPTAENLDDSTLSALSETPDTNKSTDGLLTSTKAGETEQLSIVTMSETPNATVSSGGSDAPIKTQLFKSISRRMSVAPVSMSETSNATKPIDSSGSSANMQPSNENKRRLSTASSTKSDTSIKTQLFESIIRRFPALPSMSDTLIVTKPIESLDGSASTHASILRSRPSIAPSSVSDTSNVTVASGSSELPMKTQLFESISKFLPVASSDASANTQSSRIRSRRLSVAPPTMSESPNTINSSGGSDAMKTKLFQTIARHLPVEPTSMPDTIVNKKPKKTIGKCLPMTSISTTTPDTTAKESSNPTKTQFFQKLLKLSSEPQSSGGDFEYPARNQSSETLRTITAAVYNPPVSVQPASSIFEAMSQPSGINKSLSKPTSSINTKKTNPNLFNQIAAQTVSSAEKQISSIDLMGNSLNADDISPMVIDETPLDPPLEIKHVRTITNPLELMATSPSSMTMTTNINSFNIPNASERLFQSMARHYPNPNIINPTGSFDVPEINQPASMSMLVKPTTTGPVFTNHGSPSDFQTNHAAPTKSYTTALQDALRNQLSNSVFPNHSQHMQQNNTSQPATSGQSDSLTSMTNMVSSTLILPRRKMVPIGNRSGLQITGSDRLNILSPQTINNRLFNNIPRH